MHCINHSTGFFIIMSPAEGLHFSALVFVLFTCIYCCYLCGLPGPQHLQERRKLILPGSGVQCIWEEKTCILLSIILLYGSVLWLTRPSRICQEDLDHFLTRGEWARMRITSTGIIKGCVQRDQFHKWLLMLAVLTDIFFTLVANKKLAL